MTTRKAAVAGKFYPNNRFDLANQIKDLQKKEKKKIIKKLPVNNIIGGIVPHAGYEYSGEEAIHFFDLLQKSKQVFDTVIIINPSHSGGDYPISLDVNLYWETPLGKVALDTEFQKALEFPLEEEAHKSEHSAEVVIPYLQQMLKYSFMIVPISMGEQSVMNARKIAAKIFETSMQMERRVLFIASSDFSHFVSPDEGIRQDDYAIEQIMSFNSDELETVVKEKKISMCGCGPIMALLEYALIVSAEPKIQLLNRGNSFKRYPSVEVVDYVSFLVYE